MFLYYHLITTFLNIFFLFQANSGMYRIQDSYLEACQERLQKQDSRYSEWGESFDCGL
jgi:RAP1 GTPase activating protein 1